MEDVWIPLVDEPIGGIVREIEDTEPGIRALVESPRRLLVFRTFASLRVALGPPATAEGLAIQIVGPDDGVIAATSAASAPPATTIPETSFSYPDDGSIAQADSMNVSLSASGPDGTASATTELAGLSLFG